MSPWFEERIVEILQQTETKKYKVIHTFEGQTKISFFVLNVVNGEIKKIDFEKR